MILTQDCLSLIVSDYSCKISTLSSKYYEALQIGSSCSNTYLFQLELATALIEQICSIDLSTETCLTDTQVEEIIDNLKIILDKYNCGCNGN